MTATTAPRSAPRRADLEHDVAMDLAGTEYSRVADTLAQLTPAQWQAPTECPGWDVRAIAGHLLGMAQMAASLRETVRQQVVAGKRAKRDGVPSIDALTALQVEQNAGRSPEQVVAAIRRVGPQATRARRRTPAIVRSRTVPEAQLVGGVEERWTFGFLLDVILTRDPFMHRIDISRACDEPMTLTPEHEGAIIDGVVREWADRHGRPFDLELSGPAGGRWREGEAGEELGMDALNFCRAVSGRGEASGLLAVQVPF